MYQQMSDSMPAAPMTQTWVTVTDAAGTPRLEAHWIAAQPAMVAPVAHTAA